LLTPNGNAKRKAKKGRSFFSPSHAFQFCKKRSKLLYLIAEYTGITVLYFNLCWDVNCLIDEAKSNFVKPPPGAGACR
jgi:hypothetical protein